MNTKNHIDQLYEVIENECCKVEEENKNEVGSHCLRVQNYASSFANYMDYDKGLKTRLKQIALYHDVGKLVIPPQILFKKEPLLSEEWRVIKDHPAKGLEMLNSVKALKDISKYVLYHHERWDGLGYPEKLKANEIPLESRIISVIDSFDAMTSKRVYKESLNCNEALVEIKKSSGTQFDPKVACDFLGFIKNFPIDN